MRTGKSWWIIIQCISTYFKNHNSECIRSAGAIIFGMFFFLLGCYFLYAVASFHALLRRMKKNSSMIVASVSQGRHDLLLWIVDSNLWQTLSSPPLWVRLVFDYKVNEGVVKDPKLQYIGWTSSERELTCKKLGLNLKKWMRFEIWKFDETEISPRLHSQISM